MRRDEEGTLWMFTGDEGIMDEQGYLRSAPFYPLSFAILTFFSSRWQDKGRASFIICYGV